MTRVRITRNEQGGSDLCLDDHPVPDLFDVSFHHEARSLPVVSASCYALDGFSLDLDASVTVHITVLPGYRLDVVSRNGRTSYRAVAESDPRAD